MPALTKITLGEPALPAGYELRTSRHAFRIVRKIASGGFGVTYQAENLMEFTVPGTSHVVPAGALLAIKECFKRDIMERLISGEARSASGSRDAVRSLRTQFLNEAFTLLRLQAAYPPEVRADAEHLGFVPVFHAGTARQREDDVNVHYFVMPFLEGGSLRKLLGRADPGRVVRISYRLLTALQLLHNDSGSGSIVLHHDIKPANIMLTGTGKPVLIDFGISTGTDNVGGTPLYSPHEQIRRETMGRYTDLYSLGVTLYELITGQRPPQYSERPPYTGTDPYSPLSANAALVAMYRQYGAAFEQMYQARTGRAYPGAGRDFATNFLAGVDLALRPAVSGAFSRWQNASQWIDFVFHGIAPDTRADGTRARSRVAKPAAANVPAPAESMPHAEHQRGFWGTFIIVLLSLTLFVILSIVIYRLGLLL